MYAEWFTKVDDSNRFASELGWTPAAQGLVGEDFIVNYYDGRDDDVPVRIRVFYRSSARTRVFLFHRAFAEWPGKGVRTDITSQKRLRELFTAYAPTED